MMKYFVSVSVIALTFCLFLPSAFGYFENCPENLPNNCECDDNALLNCKTDNATLTIIADIYALIKVSCFGISDENIFKLLDFDPKSISFPFDTFYSVRTIKIDSCPMSVVMSFDDLAAIPEIQMKVSDLKNLPANYLNYRKSSHLKYFAINESKQLKTLPANIFENFTNLKSLSIVDTNMTTLPKTIFRNLTNLRHLDLSRNNLTSLDESIFDGLLLLSTLTLADNHLKTLPANILNGLHLDILELKNNPWQCDRDFLKMLRSLDTNNAHYHVLCPDGEPPDFQLICPSECECVMEDFRRTIIVNSSTSDMNKMFSELILPNGIREFLLIVQNKSLKNLPNILMEGYQLVTEIFAANNLISNITVDNLPRRLTKIDLRGNKLETLSAPVVDRLKDVPKVWLANNNPWTCDDVFLDFIQLKQENIDFEFIYCNDDEPIVAKLDRYTYWITNNLHERLEPQWTNEVVRRIDSNTDETGQICPSECDCVISAKKTTITYRCSFVDLTRLIAHFDLAKEHWPKIKNRFVKF